MTYIRNSSGDLVYDQNTSSYISAGYNVLAISRSAFLKSGYLNPNVQTVDMNNVPFINNTMYSAFSSFNNSNLTMVTNINDNTVNMSRSFHNCYNLIEIDKFPNSVTQLTSCFYNCRNLSYVPSIPNSVTTMIDTFRNCINLTSIPNMPDSVVYASGAYRDMSSLTIPPVLSNNLDPSTGLTLAFYGSGITSLPNIPNSITSLHFTFSNCNSLVNCYSMPLPNSVVNMSYTFANCIHLVDSPIIPNSVTDLESTFINCTNLTNAPSIPDSVTILSSTFCSCTNLTGSLYIYSNNITNATNCFANTTRIKEVYIPFTYSNNIYTQTYNSFIAAGYDENGTKEGVYLIDLKFYKLNVDGFTYTSDVHNNVVLETYTGEATTITLPNLEEN